MARRGRPRHPDILTPRQWEVLDLIRSGHTDQEIADTLSLTLAGAKYHVSEILTKLNVPSREDAATWEPGEEKRRWRGQILVGSMAIKIVAAAIVVAAVCGLGLLALGVANSGSGERTQTPSSLALATGTDTPVPGTLGPTLIPASNLTASQRQQMEQIVRDDPRMKEITGGISYTFQSIGPWIAGAIPATGDDVLIGGVATVVLSRPIDHIERDWPFAGARSYYASWPADARAKYLPYSEGKERIAVDGLREMYVQVDLSRRQLVAIEVNGIGDEQTITYPGPTPQISLGVTSDTQDIFAKDERLQAILAGRASDGALDYTYTLDGREYAIETYTFTTEPQDIEAEWTVLVGGDRLRGELETASIHFLARGVRSISALLDLDRDGLVYIQPSEHAPGD